MTIDMEGQGEEGVRKDTKILGLNQEENGRTERKLRRKSVISILTSVLLGSLGRFTQPSFRGHKVTDDPLGLWPYSYSVVSRNQKHMLMGVFLGD